MKPIRINLLLRIIIAIAAGIGIGWVAPEWIARLCATFNEIFGSFLSFLIPLIILGFVTPAIADIGRKAGAMLVATAARLSGYDCCRIRIILHRTLAIPRTDKCRPGAYGCRRQCVGGAVV